MGKIKKDRVLITGVAGFIGSNLAKLMVKEGYKVTGIDNLSQGAKRNISGFEKTGSFDFIKADVRDHEGLKKRFKGCRFDYIVHLAAFKIPRYGNAMDTLMINSKGTESMLDIARDKKAKFVFASTSDVYGKNAKLPFSETSDLVIGPSSVKRWAYAVSKMFDEHLCFAYQEKYGVESVIIRFFGGYGANQNTTWWGGPQSVFIDCALNNKPMTLHGDGSKTRSFTYIDDTVRGVYLATVSPDSGGEIFNIGNDREITIRGLAEMIWKMVRGNTKPKIKIIPYDALSKGYEDVMRRIPDISKAEKMLGFRAVVQLEGGLPLTIQWQKGISG
ncbi:MAG: SDR family NAD(P)-dependent oxidoreductase [Candidatus Omnitrophota bacterium]